MSAKDVLADSAIADPDALPGVGTEWVGSLGRVLVVAPHPDDEVLGCGGVLALLARMGAAVRVLVVSDGTQSHPNSRKYPAPALKTLRENETRHGLDILGIGGQGALFLGYKDRAVPNRAAPDFAHAMSAVGATIAGFQPQTVFAPWRRDPHPDHRAAYELVAAAIERIAPAPRLIEYLIWTWEIAQAADVPRREEVRAWRLDIGGVADLKQAAIAAHLSQTTDLIDDDPDGFRLTPDVLAHFRQDWELFVEGL